MAEETKITENESKEETLKETQSEETKETKKTEKKDKKLSAELEEAKKKCENYEKLLEEANDKYLRMAAEYENFRKRAQKEKEGIYSDAKIDCIKEFLPTLDNLERAVAFGESDKLAEGVGMTLNMFKGALEKIGVSEIEAENAKFDPNFHNAVMHIEDESLEENTIVEVFGKGYKIGDKVIRYSMVKVAN